MMIKKVFGAAGIAFVVLCAAGAGARSSTAIDGRPWSDSDDACFTSENYGVIANSCGTTKTFRVGGQSDGGGTKTVNMFGRGNGSAATLCVLIATDAPGVTVSSVGVQTTSATKTTLLPANQTVLVPTEGQIYAHCDVAPGGALSSFRYTP